MKKKFKLFFIIIFILIFIISLLFLYSRFIATNGLVVKEYKITNSNLSDKFHGLKIVHLSDLHYGTTFNNKELTKLINKINLTKPDIVVLTGDLFDKSYEPNNNQINHIIKSFNQIETTIGKYAISGDQDNNSNWEKIINNSHFINLNNDYTSIYDEENNYIFLAGLSSNLNDEINPKINKIENYLSSLNNENQPIFKILLMHEPDYINNFNYSNYDLILAGHSLNGQIRIPFLGAIYTPKGSKKYFDEYYKLKNTDLYISSGLGTTKYNFRFLNKPSFNLYRLTNK